MNRRSPLFLCLFVVTLLAGLSLFLPQPRLARGQEPAPPSVDAVKTLTAEEASRHIQDIENRLKDLEMRSPTDEIPAEDLLQRRNALITLQNLYRRFVTLEEKTVSLKSELERLSRSGEELSREEVPQPPPFNLTLYDKYLDQFQALNQQYSSLQTSAKLAEGALAAAQKQVLEEERKLRRLNEQREQAGEQYPERLAWDIQAATLIHEISQVAGAFQASNLENLANSLKILEIKRGRLQRTISWIAENLSYDQEELDRILAKSQARVAAIQDEIQKTSEQRDTVEQEYFKAQARVERTMTEGARAIAQSALEAVETRRLLIQQRLEKAQLELSLPNMVQRIWTERYSLLRKDLPTEEMWKARETAENRGVQLRQTLTSTQQFQNSIQARRVNTRQQLEDEGLHPDQIRYLRAKLKSLEAMTEVNLDAISLLISVDNLNSRLMEELESRMGTVQITKRVSAFGRQRFLDIWQAELWTSGGHGVTVGKLVIALLLVTLGTLFSHRIARLVRNRLLVRFDLDVDVAESVERLLFYILIIVFILWSLKMVKIPLTAFAFLGGAVAIGFGFGAQKFFSNLISGFLIMAQKPFRINDVIQVDDIMASVKSVGSRYTKIQTFDNLDLLVPNSYLLDNKIVNWTLTDKIIRQKITVGVDYVSDPRQTERLLLQAVKEHVKVLPSPEPFVIFRDFGDSALVFDVLYWVNLDFGRSWFAASDIRYRIVELFREAGIVIAFPQTDVHLDVNSPIEIRMEDRRHSENPRPPRPESGSE